MTESHHEQAEGTDEQPSAAGMLVISTDLYVVTEPPGRGISRAVMARAWRRLQETEGAAPATKTPRAERRRHEAEAIAESASPAAIQAAQVSDAHYSQVRRAVGRGAPTVLFGTSTRSLERSLAKLIAVQQGKPAR